MKNLSQLWDQKNRLQAQAMRRAVRECIAADSATGNHRGLAFNWGNPEARAAWKRFDARIARIDAAHSRMFGALEHATHVRDSRDGKYLWCDHCAVTRKKLHAF